MKSVSLLLTAALAGLGTAAGRRSLQHVGRKIDLPPAQRARHGYPMQPAQMAENEKRANTLIPQNANTTKFAVDGTKIPEVDFDVGESYAGLLPIGSSNSSGNSSDSLYFWFFPTENEAGKDEIVIWLNGGPGCSSLEGFFQENGPVLWQYGTYKPVKNPWTWVNLTNVVWVEQPVGTGFTQGTPTATSETEVAQEFLGFFKNFVDTFGLQNKKIYVTGESYAGYYVPYISSAMLDKKDKVYYDLTGSLIYDPVIGDQVLQTQVPIAKFTDDFSYLFNFNGTFEKHVKDTADKCGYTSYLKDHLKFPPPATFRPAPNASAPGCDLFDEVFNAVSLTNPCFDIYQIATTCPLLWDVLGFPGSFDYVPEGATIYFNRTDVQKAINAPIQEWLECSPGVLTTDTSPYVAWSVWPGVIERSERTLIAHANMDMILLYEGAQLVIQNMTWGGKKGFQKRPDDDFFVPYHSELSPSTLAASGVMGVTHTERKLTWVETWLSGHMVPQYQPSAAYRQLEYLLGRIESLSTKGDFTTDKGGYPGNKGEL